MFTKKNIIALLMVVLLGLTVLSPIYAADNNKQENFFTQFVNYISQKFGLNKTQVQTAVDEFKQENKKEVQKNAQDREKTRLDELVKQGKITQEQETAILNELKTLREKYITQNNQNLTQEERQKQRQAEQDELKAWATTNGIDYLIIMPQYPTGGMRPSGAMQSNDQMPSRGKRNWQK